MSHLRVDRTGHHHIKKLVLLRGSLLSTLHFLLHLLKQILILNLLIVLLHLHVKKLLLHHYIVESRLLLIIKLSAKWSHTILKLVRVEETRETHRLIVLGKQSRRSIAAVVFQLSVIGILSLSDLLVLDARPLADILLIRRSLFKFR